MTLPTSRRGLLATALAGAAVLPLAACTQEAVDCSKVAPAETPPIPAPIAISDWMSWQGGVDLAAVTDPSFTQPNVIIHLANMVHTPVGSAPSGMVLYQPDPKANPVVMGFVSSDPKLAAWFGPHIFAGTPFEKAPALSAAITITEAADMQSAGSKITVAGHVFEVTFTDLGALAAINRPVGSPMPFSQAGMEAIAGKVMLKVDGTEVAVTVPAVGLSGGNGAVWSPAGIYAR